MTERLTQNEEGFAFVPEYLRADQNILDQPPFTWLFEKEDVFPFDLTDKPEEFRGRFIRFYLSHFTTNKILNNMISIKHLNEVFSFIEEKYKNKIFLKGMLKETKIFLRNYPKIDDYLRQMWHRPLPSKYIDFDKFGRRVGNKAFEFSTYAAYIGRRLEADSKWVGLVEILPDASAAEGVTSFIPMKGSTNRYFRLIKSEALG